MPTVFDGDYLTVGAGAAYVPGYEGSDSYVVTPVLGLQGRLGGFTISPRPAGAAIDLVNEPSDAKIAFSLGPVTPCPLRSHQADSRSWPSRRAASLKTAIEVGANAGFSINRITNPYDSLSFGADIRWDANGAQGRR